MNSQQRFDINAIVRLLRRFLRLNIENMRLSLTERLTILMSAVAFYIIALFFCTIGFIFITAGIAHLLEGCLEIKWVYLIIGGIYFAIVLVLWLLRKKILVDPICRFLSRLIVEAPPAK
ncbi:MAG: phage holin family protein [Muribaculaceae bacterium]|nr:phage holin family protein [Muribaculaceae bacterium]